MLHNKSANEFKMKFVTFQDVHVVCTQLLFGPIRFKSGVVYTRRGGERRWGRYRLISKMKSPNVSVGRANRAREIDFISWQTDAPDRWDPSHLETGLSLQGRFKSDRNYQRGPQYVEPH